MLAEWRMLVHYFMIPLPFITCRHRPQSLGEITNKMNWDRRREWMKMACRGVNPPRPVGGQNKRALTWTICQIATAIALAELRFPVLASRGIKATEFPPAIVCEN